MDNLFFMINIYVDWLVNFCIDGGDFLSKFRGS